MPNDFLRTGLMFVRRGMLGTIVRRVPANAKDSSLRNAACAPAQADNSILAASFARARDVCRDNLRYSSPRLLKLILPTRASSKMDA